jgi:hypothetical protein
VRTVIKRKFLLLLVLLAALNIFLIAVRGQIDLVCPVPYTPYNYSGPWCLVVTLSGGNLVGGTEQFFTIWLPHTLTLIIVANTLVLAAYLWGKRTLAVRRRRTR